MRAATWLGALLGMSLLVAAAAAAAADSTTVYRCGQTYQQVPCDGGKAVAVQDSRDAAQRDAAKQAATAERRTAEQLAAERREREKLPAPRPAASSAARHAVAAAPKADKPRHRHTKPLEANDKTLYAPRKKAGDKPPAPTDARMPSS